MMGGAATGLGLVGLLLAGCTPLQKATTPPADAGADAGADVTPDGGVELVAWWKAEGDPGDERRSLGARFEGEVEPGYTAGRDGGLAVSFRGTGSWVVPESRPSELHEWSITAWVRVPRDAPRERYHAILAREYRDERSQFRRNFWFGITDPRHCGHLTFGASFASHGVIPRPVDTQDRCGETPIAPGVWTHLASTFDGAVLSYYLDGVPAGTVTVSEPCDVSDGHTLTLGSTAALQQIAWVDLDDVKLFRGALSPAEVAAEAR